MFKNSANMLLYQVSYSNNFSPKYQIKLLYNNLAVSYMENQ